MPTSVFELAEWNIEREYSQSFRSLEFLRHGLPLLCNRYLPTCPAGRGTMRPAGSWTSPPGCSAVLSRHYCPARRNGKQRSGNARKGWCAESPATLAGRFKPLLDLAGDHRPRSRHGWSQLLTSGEQPPVLGVPPLAERLRRQLSLARTVSAEPAVRPGARSRR